MFKGCSAYALFWRRKSGCYSVIPCSVVLSFFFFWFSVFFSAAPYWTDNLDFFVGLWRFFLNYGQTIICTATAYCRTCSLVQVPLLYFRANLTVFLKKESKRGRLAKKQNRTIRNGFTMNMHVYKQKM